jgi:hypothetical protein
MKKLLVVAILLGGGGYYAYGRWFQPERRACAKMAELCGSEKHDVDKCEADMKDMKKSLGDESARKFDACVADAKSCPEAAGCMLGAAGSGLGDAMNKFIQGVGKGITK